MLPPDTSGTLLTMGRAADMLEVAALPVRPTELARAAAALPTPAAAALGRAGASLCLGIWLASDIGGNEPFRNMAHYARQWVYFAVIAAVVLALAVTFVAGVGIGLVWVFLRALDLRWPRVPLGPVPRAMAHVVLLAPLCGLAPLAGWSLCAAITSVPHPNFGIASGKPAWVTWPGFAFLSQEHWLAIWLAALATFAVWGCTRVPGEVARRRALRDAVGCKGCGYPREGLKHAAACPECGAPFEPAGDPA